MFEKDVGRRKIQNLKVRALDIAAQDEDCEAQLHGIALEKLVAQMEDF